MFSNLLSQITRRIKPSTKRRIKFLLKTGRIKNPFVKLGLSTYDYANIDQRPVVAPSSCPVFGRSISYSGGYWFLYSLNEIFLEEVYKFESSNASPVIIDCGANIGLSVIYFKRLFPGSRIIAYEPDKQVFSLLEKNIRQFDYRDIELINKAVWTTETELEFTPDGSLGGRIKTGTLPNRHDFIIKTDRLRNHLKQKVDFLKLDIEGAEYDVLLDCTAELKNVNLLFFEYHRKKDEGAERLEELLKVVSGAGFRYYIKESYPIVRLPFAEKAAPELPFDLLLNVFCYRN
jgi:FkbM family methyltransferase